MKPMARRALLNPAFKRFQYLPHLPANSAGKHARPAPRWEYSETEPVSLAVANLGALPVLNNCGSRPTVILE